jgi:ferrous iron transport protein B
MTQLATKPQSVKQLTIGLVGNPNCGKTTLFNALTGAKQWVGNWAGVTVERKEGSYRYHDQMVTVVDLPGVYSVDAEDTATGLDELVARGYLLLGEADLVINIVDASNLEGNLYLTTQILEMGVPIVIALNMMDLAERREIRIDPQLLSQRLGCPVIPLCAHSGKGVPQLQQAIQQALAHPTLPHTYVAYPAVIETALAEIIPWLEANAAAKPANVRWAALSLLQYDDRALPDLGQTALQRIAHHRHQIHQILGEDTNLLIADSPYT